MPRGPAACPSGRRCEAEPVAAPPLPPLLNCLLLSLLALLLSCGGQQRDVHPGETTSPDFDHSAAWLRTQPGPRVAGLSFHLIDAAGRVLNDWDGLSLRRTVGADTARTRFELLADGAVPDDLYLYVTYPDQQLSFQSAAQDSAWDGQYLLLSVPHRLRDVVIIGLARTAPWRGAAAPDKAPALLSLEFMAGAEPVYRGASSVNEDPGSAPELSVSPGPGAAEATLSWEERNLGDYNNNGIVEITDLTPIGLNYQQKVSDSPTPKRLEIIDGSMDGVVNVQDLTRIGANFQRRIEGYQVYRDDSLDPDPTEMSPLHPGDSSPSVRRSTVLDAASPEARKERLRYEFTDQLEPGKAYTWNVRAWSGNGAAASEGRVSNNVSYEVPLANLAPLWDSTIGLTSAVGASGSDGSGALRLGFGRAIDPEGTLVTYKLRYIEGQQAVGNPGTVSIDIPGANVAGDPPYSYLLEGLTRGSFYTLNLQAQDSDGLREQNSVSLQARVPMLAVSSDPWPYERGSIERTGFAQLNNLKEPLGQNWTTALIPAFPYQNEPLAAAAGWIGISSLGSLQLLESASGELFDTWSGWGLPATFRFAPCVFDSTAAVPTGAGLAIVDGAVRTDYSADTGPATGNLLLLGDYVFSAFEDGSIRSIHVASGEESWAYQPSPPQQAAQNSWRSLATDAVDLFAMRHDGLLVRIDLLKGEAKQSAITGLTATAELDPLHYLSPGLVLDNTQRRLFASTPGADLSVFSADSLSLVDTLAVAGLQSIADPLIAASVEGRRIVGLFGHDLQDGNSQFAISAWDADSLAHLWTSPVETLPSVALPGAISGNAERFFVAGRSLRVYDYQGRLRQELHPAGPGPVRSHIALIDSQMLCNFRSNLRSYVPAGIDSPPGWPTPEDAGVQSLSSDCDSITVNWDSATDPDGEPVRYSIFIRAGQAPQLDAPFSNTSVISDIEDSGTGSNSYTIEGLDDGLRYFIALRAYAGFWDEAPLTDGNTTVQATTTCWDQDTFVLDGGSGEFSLPQGEVFAMRGVVEPAAGPLAAHMHLVYNDKADAHLTHLFQDSASVWQDEGPGLSVYETGAFEPVWDAQNGRLCIGFADQNFAGVLNRTGTDSWDDDTFVTTDTVTNPMLSLAIGPASGDERALVYTELINPALPPDEDYFYLQTSSGAWGGALSLDSANFSGRDLDLLLDPADSAKLWLAEQRGTSYAPNRFTPDRGSLYFAGGDGAGGFSFTLVDAGANGANSDCGKRVQQETGPGGLRHMAYYDLNADPAVPVGELKYAFFDGANWQIETVSSFDLSFQDLGGGLVSTYSELGFATCLDAGVEKPMIATFGRTSITLAPEEPHFAKVILWVRDGPDNWRFEELSDHLLAFPKDRAPCVLLRGDDGRPNIFVGSGDPAAQPQTANWILHFARQN